MLKYNELQLVIATQKLSCKANFKTPFFFHSVNYMQMFFCLNEWLFQMIFLVHLNIKH
jgi:hypothetical protein